MLRALSHRSGEGTIWSERSIRTPLSLNKADCAGSLAKSASSPRPRRLVLFTGFYLLGELPVRFGTGGKRVIFQDGLAIAGGFAHAYAPGDDRCEDSLSEVLDELIFDLRGQDGSFVKHSHQDTQQGKVWIQTLLDQTDRPQQVRQPFQGIVLTLDGDDDFVCRCQCVEGQKTERWRAVDDDIIPGPVQGSQAALKNVLAAVHAGQFQLGARQVDRRGGQREVVFVTGQDSLLDRIAGQQARVDVGRDIRRVDAQARGCISLWVEVDKQDVMVALGERCGERQCGGCLAYTALLVGNGDDSHEPFLLDDRPLRVGVTCSMTSLELRSTPGRA